MERNGAYICMMQPTMSYISKTYERDIMRSKAALMQYSAIQHFSKRASERYCKTAENGSDKYRDHTPKGINVKAFSLILTDTEAMSPTGTVKTHLLHFD